MTTLNTFQTQILQYGGGGGGTGGAGPQGPTGPGPDIPIPSNTDLTDPIAIGTDAGAVSQTLGSVAIGFNAANVNQAGSAVAVGNSAGSTDQQFGAVAIGGAAGSDTQGFVAVAIGINAAQQGQQGGAVAIGNEAGRDIQGDSAIAIGNETAKITQGERAIAIGKLAGEATQGIQGIAIGSEAGRNNQGMDSIAIGTSAGVTNQAANSIILNASGTTLDAATTGFFVHPVQEFAGPKSLYYDASTKEITYFDAPMGSQGAEGFQGLEGLQGFDGTQGFQGVQGEQGFQGVQGEQGFQGVQGEQGFQGFQGLVGATGVVEQQFKIIQYNFNQSNAGTFNSSGSMIEFTVPISPVPCIYEFKSCGYFVGNDEGDYSNTTYFSAPWVSFGSELIYKDLGDFWQSVGPNSDKYKPYHFWLRLTVVNSTTQIIDFDVVIGDQGTSVDPNFRTALMWAPVSNAVHICSYSLTTSQNLSTTKIIRAGMATTFPQWAQRTSYYVKQLPYV